MKKLKLVYLILALSLIFAFLIIFGRTNVGIKNIQSTEGRDNQTMNNSQAIGFVIENNQTINNSQTIENNQTNQTAGNKTIKSSGGGGGGSSSQTTNPVTEDNPTINNSQEISYPIHEDISVTFFWVGESANGENGFISNKASAWDDKWLEHYGGVDNPNNRNGSFPSGFIPKENPFYFALPYNDFNENGNRKSNSNRIYWYNEKNFSETESICKNRWIKITKGNLTAYAQWEDVGPFNENDVNYVFGNSEPENKINNNAGLDVSPAVHDYLNLEDIDVVDWQFVDFSDVPEGPWKEIITTSQIFWD